MTLVRQIVVVLLVGLTMACDSGDDTVEVAPVVPWLKFRRDVSNTGQGVAELGFLTGIVQWATQIDEAAPKPISATSAIGIDGSLYVGSEGGTLAAVDPLGNVRWRATSCGACVDPTQRFDAFVSSPTIFTQNNVTFVFAATRDGRLVVFEDLGSAAVCTMCFAPQTLDPNLAAVSFASSPTFTRHPLTGNVTGVFVGATIERSGGDAQAGKMYAVNFSGAPQWEFPARTASDIGPVTSSPALDAGLNLYFVTADGIVIAVTSSGREIWRFALSTSSGEGSETPLAPSAVTTGSRVFASSTDGRVVALSLGGQLVWDAQADGTFDSSLTIGSQNLLTPTPTATGAATPTPTPTPPINSTPTPTPTFPGAQTTLYGITRAGQLVVLDAALGQPVPLIGPTPPPIAGEVTSSPALSIDNLLVFGTTEGMLYVVDTATGLPLSGWPVELVQPGESTKPIRSSPAIGANGTIYVGSDDGRLYATGVLR